MNLTDIKASITELSDDDLRKLLSDIRTNRRVSKRPPIVHKEAKSELSTETLLNNINSEQAAMLLKMLEGK